MAIVSISRIQHRRGLYADLPLNLNEAELGWCLDTRQLFIGNGNTYTGNSQILTQWSPNDDIITHVYQGYTGNAANTAVSGTATVRTLNSILNDYLSVKDYGAVGDGVTDDTAAIQQAISDEWQRIADAPYSSLMSRNTIFFPSGTYLISSPLKLYPFTSLRGEGINRTAITMAAGSTGPVLQTSDSLGQTESNIGLNSGVLPTDITIDGMTIDGSLATSGYVVQLDRCERVDLVGCEIINSWTTGDGGATGLHGIVIQSLGTGVATGNISVTGCTIRNSEIGVYAGDPITDIRVADCDIYTCFIGSSWSSSVDGMVDGVTVSGCDISGIDLIGTLIDTNYAVSSIGNNYRLGNAGAIGVYITSNGFIGQSLGDTFDIVDPLYQVWNQNVGYNLVFGPQQTGLTNNAARPWSLPINANQVNQPLGISYNVVAVASTFASFVDYSLSLDTYCKSGRLSIISDGSTAAISDAATELNLDASVTFSVVVSSGTLSVNYSSTGTTSGTMKYVHTYWVA